MSRLQGSAPKGRRTEGHREEVWDRKQDAVKKRGTGSRTREESRETEEQNRDRETE